MTEKTVVRRSAERRKNEGKDVWHFRSAPALRPMRIQVLTIDNCGDLLFLAPYAPFGARLAGQTGSLIVRRNGQVVWFKPFASRFVQNTDFRVQRWRGRRVLTCWEGTISGTQTTSPNLPAGDPEPGAFYRVRDSSYRTIFKLRAQRGYTSDLHEFSLTCDLALFSAIKQVPADLRRYGGPQHGSSMTTACKKSTPQRARCGSSGTASGTWTRERAMCPRPKRRMASGTAST